MAALSRRSRQGSRRRRELLGPRSARSRAAAAAGRCRAPPAASPRCVPTAAIIRTMGRWQLDSPTPTRRSVFSFFWTKNDVQERHELAASACIERASPHRCAPSRPPTVRERGTSNTSTDGYAGDHRGPCCRQGSACEQLERYGLPRTVTGWVCDVLPNERHRSSFGIDDVGQGKLVGQLRWLRYPRQRSVCGLLSWRAPMVQRPGCYRAWDACPS